MIFHKNESFIYENELYNYCIKTFYSGEKMELILKEADIISILKKHFSGTENIILTFDEKRKDGAVNATLTVSEEIALTAIKNTKQTIAPVTTTVPTKEVVTNTPRVVTMGERGNGGESNRVISHRF